MIKVENIAFTYPNQSKITLNNLSFEVRKREWLAIVGHNGSGKSTVAKMLNGLLTANSGHILIEDTKLTEESIWDIRRKIGMVFQNPDNQFVGTIVKDDVAFGLENNGIAREIMIERVEKALKQVRMEAFSERQPHYLSGGQKQRVAIAGVLALSPSIIILDEATSMLDPQGRQEVLETIRFLKEEKDMTVISITHHLEEVVQADRVIVMKQGQIIAEGSPKNIFKQTELLEEASLDAPFIVKLANELEEAGIEIGEVLRVEELVSSLWRLYSTK